MDTIGQIREVVVFEKSRELLLHAATMANAAYILNRMLSLPRHEVCVAMKYDELSGQPSASGWISDQDSIPTSIDLDRAVLSQCCTAFVLT